jgi:membrane-associated PAP2 superfamily phosphatase
MTTGSVPIRLSRAPQWIALGWIAMALSWDASGWDLPLARLAGTTGGFPWREHWLLAGLLHDGARRAAWVLALAVCAAVWWPVGPLRRLARTRRLQLAVTALLAAFIVVLLKAASTTSCPWDLAEFGGAARHVSHWQSLSDGGAGHCFPAGHASSGFSFFAGYFAFVDGEPALARKWLIAAAAGGLLLGVAQQWRGAHFMSHTLWSAAFCWCVAYAVDGGFRLARVEL